MEHDVVAHLAYAEAERPLRLTVIVPVTRKTSKLRRILDLYLTVLDTVGDYEILYVVSYFDPLETRDLVNDGDRARIIRVPAHFREASCVREGTRQARSANILVLPPYLQVAPNSIPAVLHEIGSFDLVVASRDRRHDSLRNRVRGNVFRAASRLASSRFDDLGCLVACGRREVFEELAGQDSQYAFLPLLAERAGFSVSQVKVVQAESDLHYRRHSIIDYGGRLLDVASISFLLGFLQKPFRFFGSVGAILCCLGVVTAFVMLFQRSAGNVPMGDRPALLLAVLLVVLGLQIAAVGLIAEVVLFTRLPQDANYRIREIVQRHGDSLGAVAGGA
jgi:hypothetical protein